MQGYEALETIKQLNGQSAAALIRHAHRYPIANPSDPTQAEITPEGAASAKAFGKRIQGFETLRLFHSPVKRCRQTAECIAEGAAKAGIAVSICGPQPELGVDYILDLDETGRLNTLHGEHFVRLWIQGQVSENAIVAPAKIAAAKLSYLTAHLAEPCERGNRLDLHVSHDWNVIILRELMLGIRHEDTGWLTFLDGMGFSLKAGMLRAVYRDRSETRPLPWLF
jgi:hypothetical protein